MQWSRSLPPATKSDTIPTRTSARSTRTRPPSARTSNAHSKHSRASTSSRRGFRCPSWEPTWRTAALVAEFGLEYDSSLMDADVPYLLETAAGDIVELPVHWSLDDWEQYAYLPRPPFKSPIESPQKVLELWISELDAMRRHGCLFVLTCHPFLSGRPHRVEVLRRLIEHALERKDVEFVDAREAARRARNDGGLPRRRVEPVVVDESVYPDY